MPKFLHILPCLLALLLSALPASAMAQTTASGKFLHLSDIHFDPFADPSLINQLKASDYTQWEAIFKSGGAQSPSNERKSDSNYALLVSVLNGANVAQSAGNYDYIIHTGDYLAHDFTYKMRKLKFTKAEAQAFAANTVSFVNLMIANALPNAPLVATLGNNDSACDDYALTPGGDILPAVGADLPVIAKDPAATRDFDAGGYYRTPHPTIANLDFIVLSVFWAHKYMDECSQNPVSPGQAQLTWLQNSLAQQQKAGRNTILLMHIPPGIDGFSTYASNPPATVSLWQNDAPNTQYLDSFLALTSQYKAQLVGAYAGHTHMDEFRVLSDTAPYLAIRMAPSVTPYNGNVPAFAVFDYDTKTGGAQDYTVFTFRNANWPKEYRFSQVYSYKDYSPASLSALAAQIKTDRNVRGQFGLYYASGNSTPAGRSGTWPYFACALTELTATTYQSCQQNASALPKKSRRSR
jgi:sphingomyelin phosphodiesterase acid-like 3